MNKYLIVSFIVIISFFKANLAMSKADFSGVIREVRQTKTYTYVRIEGKNKQIWAAMSKVDVKKGQKMSFKDGMPFRHFPSKALNKTFDELYLLSDYSLDGKSVDYKKKKRSYTKEVNIQGTTIELGSIKVADMIIADLYKNRKKLKGNSISLRGKVVKYSPKIMGKNWAHVHDGSGEITVLTTDSTKVGDVVLVKGKLELNKDLEQVTNTPLFF